MYTNWFILMGIAITADGEKKTFDAMSDIGLVSWVWIGGL
jgi:hypothetical protein